tara:strand:+ start:780 stop:1499 length:720 start_codon:yes stop_codon:yes gene_type:complete
MARISTYGIDGKPELGDKIIGTDTGALANLATKNYSLGEIVALFNEKNRLGVADQSIFLFQDDITDGRSIGTISFQSGGGVGTSFGSITTLLISKYVSGGGLRDKFTELFIGKDIILAELNNVNNFGTYRVLDVVQDVTETDFFVVTVQNNQFNGVLSLDAHYIFSEFTNRASTGDLTFVFSQGVPAVQWAVQHNLDKFPSVSVVNNNNIVINGEVTYIDTNNVQLDFSAAFAGKAYLN